jgi:hypothetical protein
LDPLLTLGGSDSTTYLFADKGCQYTIYNSVQQFTTQITNDAKPKIVYALLTLIFMMGQEACNNIFVYNGC